MAHRPRLKPARRRSKPTGQRPTRSAQRPELIVSGPRRASRDSACCTRASAGLSKFSPHGPPPHARIAPRSDPEQHAAPRRGPRFMRFAGGPWLLDLGSWTLALGPSLLDLRSSCAAREWSRQAPVEDQTPWQWANTPGICDRAGATDTPPARRANGGAGADPAGIAPAPPSQGEQPARSPGRKTLSCRRRAGGGRSPGPGFPPRPRKC